MANTQVLQRDFGGGFAQDYPRDQMPPGKVWWCENALPSNDGVSLYRRAGGFYYNNSVTNLTYIYGGSSADGVIAILGTVSSTVTWLNATDSATVPITFTSRGSATITNPNDFAYYNGATYCCQVNSSTLGKLTGNTAGTWAPAGVVAYCIEAHKSRLAVGAASKVWFTDPASETIGSLSYIDFSFAVRAMASISGMLLVFTPGGLFRVRGDTPPPARNMIVEKINPVVCDNPVQVFVHNDLCYFATNDGIYVTDGASFKDITKSAGIKQWWRDNMTRTLYPGIGVQDNMIMVYYATNKMVLIIDESKAFGIASDVFYPLGSFSKSTTIGQDLLLTTSNSSGRLVNLSSIFNTGSSTKSDPNGTAHVMTVETPFYGAGHLGRKRMRNAYFTYDLRDAASDNPTLTPSFITSPENTSYTSMTALAESTALTRVRRGINKLGHGVAFKLLSANATSDCKVYGVEVESRAQEHSRLA